MLDSDYTCYYTCYFWGHDNDYRIRMQSVWLLKPYFTACYEYCGGTVASWLVSLTLDWAVWVESWQAHYIVFLDKTFHSHSLGIQSFRPMVISPPVISPHGHFAPSHFAPSHFAPSHFAPTKSHFIPYWKSLCPIQELLRSIQKLLSINIFVSFRLVLSESDNELQLFV